MTGPGYTVMCSLINKQTHAHMRLVILKLRMQTCSKSDYLAGIHLDKGSFQSLERYSVLPSLDLLCNDTKGLNI